MMTALGRSLICVLMGVASAAYARATPPPPPLPGGPEDANLSISAGAGDGGTEVRIVTPDAEDGQQQDYSVEIIELKEGDVVERRYNDGQDDDSVFDYAEHMPEFRDGDETNFTRWVMKRVQYPVKAMEEGIQGKVVVRFIVEKCGNIGNFEVMSSPDELLDREVLRVMAQSPKWIPGKRHGKPVRVYFTLPVMFKLQ